MYAIIEDGGRQYKVEEGQQIDIDYRGAPAGDEITFDRVLLCSGEAGPRIGAPHVDGASVTAEIVATVQGKKIFVQKFKRRKNMRRRTGHRQLYNTVRIKKIDAGAATAGAPSAAQQQPETPAAESPASEAPSSD